MQDGAVSANSSQDIVLHPTKALYRPSTTIDTFFRPRNDISSRPTWRVFNDTYATAVRKHGDVTRLRLHLRQPSGLQRLVHASNDVFRSRNVHMEPNKAADPRIVRLFLDLSSSLDLSVVVPSPRDPQRGRRPCALMYGLHFPSSIGYEDVGSPDGGLPPQNRRSCFLVSSTRMS